MKTLSLSTCALALAAASLLPAVADARVHHYRHHVVHQRTCSNRQNQHATNGTIIGAVGGGIVGNSLARGDRTGGTLLGAGVGALAGHAVGRSTVRC